MREANRIERMRYKAMAVSMRAAQYDQKNFRAFLKEFDHADE